MAVGERGVDPHWPEHIQRGVHPHDHQHLEGLERIERAQREELLHPQLEEHGSRHQSEVAQKHKREPREEPESDGHASLAGRDREQHPQREHRGGERAGEGEQGHEGADPRAARLRGEHGGAEPEAETERAAQRAGQPEILSEQHLPS